MYIKDLFFVIERTRNLYFDADIKIKLAPCYSRVTSEQIQDFNRAISEYRGRVNFSFIEKAYDRYVYSLFAKDLEGQTMHDYLIANETGFTNKKPSSFSLQEEQFANNPY